MYFLMSFTQPLVTSGWRIGPKWINGLSPGRIYPEDKGKGKGKGKRPIQ